MINVMYIFFSLGIYFSVMIQIIVRKVRPSKDSLSLSLGGGKTPPSTTFMFPKEAICDMTIFIMFEIYMWKITLKMFI